VSHVTLARGATDAADAMLQEPSRSGPHALVRLSLHSQFNTYATLRDWHAALGLVSADSRLSLLRAVWPRLWPGERAEMLDYVRGSH